MLGLPPGPLKELGIECHQPSLLPRIIEVLSPTRHMGLHEQIPVWIPECQPDEASLAHKPGTSSQERPGRPDDGKQQQPGVETEDHPAHRPQLGGAPHLGALPQRAVNIRFIPIAHIHGSMAPPTSPSKPMITVPPPSKPPLTKWPTEPARMPLNGLS